MIDGTVDGWWLDEVPRNWGWTNLPLKGMPVCAATPNPVPGFMLRTPLTGSAQNQLGASHDLPRPVDDYPR